MADNNNTDSLRVDIDNAENLKDRIEVLQKEIHDYAKFQRFSLKEFKRSDTFKKYSSLSTFIPETNKSVGADVARLLMGRFKEKRNISPLRNEATGELIRDERGNLRTVDKTDNSFRAQLKRSGLTSFGRYISDDKQGIFYDILRTAAGRFGDDFIGKKNALSAHEKQISELSSQEQNRENASTESSDGGEILTKIYENTEGIATALNVSNRKSEEFTEEIINLSKKNVDVGVKTLDAQTKKNATALEKELETKNTLEDVSVALKDIQKSVKNTVNLTTKSVGGAGGGEGGVLDDIADAANILSFGKGILGKVGGAFGSIFGKVKGFGASTAGMLKHGAKVGTDKALPLLHTAKDSVKSVSAKVGEKLNPIKDSAKKVLDKGKSVGTNALEKGKAVGTNVLEKGKAIGTNVLDKGKGLLESGKSAVNNIPTPKIFDFAKKGGLIGAGITAVSSIFDINKASDEIDEKVKLGIISKEDANRAKTNSAIEIGSKGAGSAVGGFVGASKGAAMGATLGSVVPVLGTGVGAVLGGLIGGFGGEKIGSWLGSLIGDSVTDDVKENASFEERYKEIDERRKTFYNTTENRQAIRKELFEKKMSEREKLVPVEKLIEISSATGESMESLLRKERDKVWREADSEVDGVLRNRKLDWETDRAKLEYEFSKANPEGYKAFKERREERRRQIHAEAKRQGFDYKSYFADFADPLEKKPTPNSKDSKPKSDKVSGNTQSKTEAKKDAVGVEGNKPKIEPKKDDVKEKGSFEERLKGINERYNKATDNKENKGLVANELYAKNLSELEKSGAIKRVGEDKDGKIIYDNQELVDKAYNDAVKEAPKELRRRRRNLDKEENDLLKEIAKSDIKLFDSIWKEKNRNAELGLYAGAVGVDPLVFGNNTKKETLSAITSNNISPSNKSQESDKMVNESERANFNEKQRQAESGKTSENVINNVHQTNVNNQTVQNRQLKPRSEQSIHDRLSPFFY